MAVLILLSVFSKCTINSSQHQTAWNITRSLQREIVFSCLQ